MSICLLSKVPQFGVARSQQSHNSGNFFVTAGKKKCFIRMKSYNIVAKRLAYNRLDSAVWMFVNSSGRKMARYRTICDLLDLNLGNVKLT